ncbi:hypothetical protein [Vibrio sp. CAU 1672]|uniref:hypothetical protein n=1 Tax=Vibrio sp. CAU 1672 TaxID=3032594 RepID=UPI0023DAA7BD|nr:hypothetical protein [Vibrio sp. CAU 1672]MDF2152743.1 hypothetical protein [Vibrio sp. CAU 1672]
MKKLIAIMMSLVLNACGGGGGDSAPPPSQLIPPAPPQEVTMQELNVPDDFNYDPLTEGTLSVDISAYSIQRAHLTLYKSFKETPTKSYQASYPSKIASVPLTGGKADITFSVSDSQGNLLVEIWFYDGTDPLQKVISVGAATWSM